jgi:hypothetical protein
MLTREDVESFLIRMEEGVQEVEPGIWVLSPETANMVVSYAPPLLILRSKVMELPEDEERRTRLCRKLLELNAGELVHGAYAISGSDVIITDTLPLENLQFSTLQASIDSMEVALASHLEVLSGFRDA